MRLTIGACRCGRRWNGRHEAHCTQCHEHFSTTQNFDRHQRRYPHAVICLAPARVGLTPRTSPYGITWKRPGRPPWTRTP
jgi:hypothetical protein